MANIKSNEKRMIQSQKIYKQSKGQRSALNKKKKITELNLTKQSVSELYSQADKLAGKGKISKNKARNIKSKIAKKLNNKNLKK